MVKEMDIVSKNRLHTAACAFVVVALAAGGCGNLRLTGDDVRNEKFWSRTYGGDSFDWIPSIVVANDGNYLLTGSTASFRDQGYDIWLVKIDSSGTILWQKVFGSSVEDLALVSSLAAGGFVIAGNIYGDIESYFVAPWVLSLDEDGDMVGYRWIVGEELGPVEAVIEFSGGDYLLGTATRIVRLDSDLNPVWAKVLLCSSFLELKSVQKVAEDEFVAAGTILARGGDSWIAGFNGDGSIQWHKSFGGGGDDRVHHMIVSHEGGYVAAGETDSSGAGESDVWVVRFDDLGNILWQRTYGGTEFDSASSITEDYWGNLVIVGSTLSFGAGDADIWVIKLDPEGSIVWEKTYGGSEIEAGYSVGISSDEGYIFAGMTNVDLWVLKVDPDGGISESCPDGIGKETLCGAMDSSAVLNDTAIETMDIPIQLRDSDLSESRSFADVETQCSS